MNNSDSSFTWSVIVHTQMGTWILFFGSKFHMGSSFYLMDYHHGHGEVPYVRFLEDNPFAACIITMRTATTRYVVHLPEKVISLQKKRTIPIDSYKLQRLK